MSELVGGLDLLVRLFDHTMQVEVGQGIRLFDLRCVSVRVRV